MLRWHDVWAIASEIESSVTEEECAYLWDRASKAKEGIIEIGSWKGRSSVILGSVAKERGIPMICVDTWADCDLFPGQDFFVQWIQNVSRAGLRPLIDIVVYRTTSELASLRLDWRWCVDLLFIDADHAYESVKSDFENWNCILSRPSTVVFHDINPKCEDFGSPRYYSELCKRFKNEKGAENIGSIFLK